VAAQELVLEPLDALVAGADGDADRERDDEDAGDSRCAPFADRGSGVRDDAEAHERDVEDGHVPDGG
jgi:hypothetical protein